MFDVTLLLFDGVFVEKILRIQPNVKKLFLLLRAADTKSATQRLNNEVHVKITASTYSTADHRKGAVQSSEREIRCKSKFLISEKVTPVAGGISCEDLGVKDSTLREEMWREVDIVLNLAATTNLDERYEVPLAINALGPKHVLSFAKKCAKLKTFLHINNGLFSAYVSGERAGVILENSFNMGESLNGTSGLDIDAEIKLADQKLNELRAEGATEAEITSAMKDLGIKTIYGWKNTYVFTKSMGEMLVGQLKENVPLVILRPSIITSTYKEPFPGWVEGIRTIDSLAVGYGKGKLTCFAGDPNSIIDLIPADMVVNAIIVAMVTNANQPSEIIYHVGSSVRNPESFSSIQDIGQRYFTEKPWINKDGTPVKVGKGLQVVNSAFCQYFQGTYIEMNRKIKFVMRLVDLYKSYLFFKGVFDDMNTEKLQMAARESCAESDLFYFDPKCIVWEDYSLNIHLPGIVKYVFK
ncbi:hypothetical protein L1049_012766 [Liquidambar formosana]|uniref:Fatty acyl-CoA reductase n=1 Tax=Liquidambar formosana TaxID=63359 RepID=A0AAP0RN40_LIQFO